MRHIWLSPRFRAARQSLFVMLILQGKFPLWQCDSGTFLRSELSIKNSLGEVKLRGKVVVKDFSDFTDQKAFKIFPQFLI